MGTSRTLTTTRECLTSPADAEVARRLASASQDGFWLDIAAPDEADFHLLDQVFHVHPLALEDVRHQNQRPKLEEYPGHAFAVLFVPEWDGKDLALREHHLFIGADFVVSVHPTPSPGLAALGERLKKSPELTKGRPPFLVYLVLDTLVDATFPALEQLDDDVDALEDEIVEKASPELLHRTYLLKHAVTDLRRFLGAQRDVFQRLVTHSVDFQKAEMTLYYRDIYDHLVRQYEVVDSLRDLLTSAMDVYLSTVSNRINQTMKTLTVIASLFLPLTFLTGFFGMNFPYLIDGFERGPSGFWAGIAVMLVATVAQFAMFKRRGWI